MLRGYANYRYVACRKLSALRFGRSFAVLLLQLLVPYFQNSIMFTQHLIRCGLLSGITGRKMGWQKDEEQNEHCFDISANECFCLKKASGFAGLGSRKRVFTPLPISCRWSESTFKKPVILFCGIPPKERRGLVQPRNNPVGEGGNGWEVKPLVHSIRYILKPQA